MPPLLRQCSRIVAYPLRALPRSPAWPSALSRAALLLPPQIAFDDAAAAFAVAVLEGAYRAGTPCILISSPRVVQRPATGVARSSRRLDREPRQRAGGRICDRVGDVFALGGAKPQCEQQFCELHRDVGAVDRGHGELPTRPAAQIVSPAQRSARRPPHTRCVRSRPGSPPAPGCRAGRCQ